MSTQSYPKIIAVTQAIKAIAEALPSVEKRSILKDKSDELLELSKEAQKWAFILDSECRQLKIRIDELEKKLGGATPEVENAKSEYAPNFTTAWSGFPPKKSADGGESSDS